MTKAQETALQETIAMLTQQNATLMATMGKHAEAKEEIVHDVAYPHITARWVKPTELHIIVKDYGNRKGATKSKKRNDWWMYQSVNEGATNTRGLPTPFVTLDAKSPSGRVTAVKMDIIEFQP